MSEKRAGDGKYLQAIKEGNQTTKHGKAKRDEGTEGEEKSRSLAGRDMTILASALHVDQCKQIKYHFYFEKKL